MCCLLNFYCLKDKYRFIEISFLQLLRFYYKNKMTLKYHQEVFDLMGISPRIDTDRLDKIYAIEKKYNISLPESVVEWLLIANMSTILTIQSSFTWIEELETFGEKNHIETLSKRNNQLLAERRIVPILSERKGDWTWFLSFQETGEDPKIMLNASEFPDTLISHPHKFSKQLFVNIWDFKLMNPTDNGFYLTAITSPVEQDDLELFRRNWNELVTTFILLTNETTYRFQKKDHFVLVKNNGEISTWYLYAQHQNALQSMLEVALKVKTLQTSIKPVPSGTDEWERNYNIKLIESILREF